MRRAATAVLGLLAGGCATVAVHVDAGQPAPRTLAVLPLGGSAEEASRSLIRGLLAARLQARGFQVVECGYVDRVLSERGWLRDPVAFDRAVVAPATAAQALGVDAVLTTDGIESTSFNWLALRRQSIGGTVRLLLASGAEWWSADYTAADTGGFLLKSGQLITEFQAQGQFGTPTAMLARIDEFVEEVTAAVPMQAPVGAATAPGLPVQIDRVQVERGPSPLAGFDRVLVRAHATPAARLQFDLGDLLGVPMVPSDGVFIGSADVPSGRAPVAVLVRARSAYGAEIRAEGRQ